MLFDRKENIDNEEILFETRQNIILGCKKVLLGFILLMILIFVFSPIVSFVGGMQVYLISFVKLPLTRYVAIALFVIIIFIILYIIWQLLSWYSNTYTITNYRIIAKKGVLYSKKTYIPFTSIQDFNTSQSLIERIIHVGDIFVYSAYDNNHIELKNITNPKKVEEIIFNEMRYSHSNQFREPIEREYINMDHYPHEGEYYYEPGNDYQKERDYSYDSYRKDDYYDYGHENLRDNLEDNVNSALNNMGFDFEPRDNGYEEPEETELYYNDPDYESMDDYYNNNKDYFQFKEPQYEENVEESREEAKIDSKKIVQRHFDKFKK